MGLGALSPTRARLEGVWKVGRRLELRVVPAQPDLLGGVDAKKTNRSIFILEEVKTMANKTKVTMCRI